MSIVRCEDCGKQIDLDFDDDYAFSDDNTYLCNNCCGDINIEDLEQ